MDGKLAHLQAILDKYPELREARREHPIDKKPTTFDHDTPLQTAARYGQGDVVAFLIEKGADVNVANGYGYTPLHLAAKGGFLNVVKQLVKAGANVDVKTKAIPGGFLRGAPADGSGLKQDPIPARTALQIAEDRKHIAVVEFLKTVK
jgi:ankyrin repeat protein